MERRDFAVIFLIFSKLRRDFADFFYRDFNTSLVMWLQSTVNSTGNLSRIRDHSALNGLISCVSRPPKTRAHPIAVL